MGIFREIAPLYEKGLTLRQIAAQTGLPKTTIRDALAEGGIVLRPSGSLPAKRRPTDKPTQIGVPPYGFSWFRGRLVADPKEIENVHLILRLRKSGRSFTGIAEHLNQLRIRPRRGSRWDHSAIRKIVNRHKDSSNQPEEVLTWDSVNSSL